MRSIDLDLIKKPKGSFVLNGKTYQVFEPTIGLLIQHAAEFKTLQEETTKKGITTAEVNLKNNEWFVREVQIFVPTFKAEDAKYMTHEQRDQILKMVFESGDGDEGEKKTKPKSRAKKK